MINREKYDAILFFQWDSQNNIFYDDCGVPVTNIFEVITPSDLLLFREDHGRCAFFHRDYPEILCVLLVDDAAYQYMY